MITFVQTAKGYKWHVVRAQKQTRSAAGGLLATTMCSSSVRSFANYTHLPSLPHQFTKDYGSTIRQSEDELCRTCALHDDAYVDIFVLAGGTRPTLPVRPDGRGVMSVLNDPNVAPITIVVNGKDAKVHRESIVDLLAPILAVYEQAYDVFMEVRS